MQLGNGSVFAVAGSKGGVGKTTTSINLSAVLAERGYEVVLVEMDLAMANVGDFLDIDVGLEGEDPTLHEALAGTAGVVEATYESPCGFDVVPSGATLQGFANADIEAVSGAIATLRFAYDAVILDTGAGMATETLVALALADETILVSSPRVASVRDTMKTRDLTRQVGGSVAGVVFVRSGSGRSPGVDHIADFLSVDLLGHVPEDSAVPSAQDVGRPVVAVEPESAAATGYRELGERVDERLDALAAADPAVLSTDRVDREESGFAFLDEGADTDGPGSEDGDTVARAGRQTPPTPTRAADGRGSGGTDDASSPNAVKADGSGVRAESSHESDDVADGDAGDEADGVDDAEGTAPVDDGVSADDPKPVDDAGAALDSPGIHELAERAASDETRDAPGGDTTTDAAVADDTDTEARSAPTDEAVAEDAVADGSEAGNAPSDDADTAESSATGMPPDADAGDDGAVEADERDESNRDDAPASVRSAARRFVDRARLLVDR